mgnify:CR=1 FL=1|jgi:hypothetical protein
MAVKGILFNTEMVRAILDGRKTCTRRIVKPQPTTHYGVQCIKPPYQPGDILYVRETWNLRFDGEKYFYKADKNTSREEKRLLDYNDARWHPSIHMPKEAARIWLKVKNVRVERLQEMKPVDVIKEGAYPDCWDCLNTYEESGSQCCYGTEEECSQCDGVMMEWEKLWNSTIKKTDIDRYGWDVNPWVWVIEFERCEKPKEV